MLGSSKDFPRILGPDGRPLYEEPAAPEDSRLKFAKDYGPPTLDLDQLKKQGKRVVHPDEMKESARWATWHITLYVQLTESTESVVPRTYYVREPGANNAAYLAVELWKKWEGPKPGKEYPTFTDRAVSMGIDENDFQNAWKASKLFRWRKYIGLQVNPVAFTFEKSETIDVINYDPDKVPWSPKMNRRGRV